MESSHNENNSAQAGGADTVGPIEHICPICGEVVGTARTLQRARLGLITEALLVQHLANSHSGATLADTEQAQTASIPDAGNGDSPSAEDAAAESPREDGGMVVTNNGDPTLVPTVYEISIKEHIGRQHLLTHRKPHACDACGARFARLDQLKVHKHSEHGLNTSLSICFMNPCTRRRLGLRDERSLINHLANTHQGATLRDNDRALAAEHGIELDAQADGASSTDDDMMSTYEEEVLSTNSSDDEGETRFESHELPEELLSTKAEAREYNPEDPATAEDEIQSKETLGQPQTDSQGTRLHIDAMRKENVQRKARPRSTSC
ncbi:hypothetical protein PG990_013611 [Apiospora arundinis]